MHVGTNDKSMGDDQISHSGSSESSFAADSDNEIFSSDENNGQ